MNRDRSNTQGGVYLGTVVGGSLSRGVEVRLDPSVSVEEVAAGAFITIHGQRFRYFGLVTDTTLDALDSQIKVAPIDTTHPLIGKIMAGTAVYGVIWVRPELTIGGDALAPQQSIQPAKSLPAHFSRVFTASEQEYVLVFGEEDQKHFYIGSPLDIETKICLDLEAFVQRSNGIFGKSGTGKSFLTRLLLIGLLQSGVASTLVFDMHNEYGWEGSDPERRRSVKGLKQLFPSQVAVFSLDDEDARRRGFSPDYLVRMGYSEIEPADIELLSGALNLASAQVEAIYLVARWFGRSNWLSEFLEVEPSSLGELAKSINVHEGALSALHRRLQRLRRMHFLTAKSEGSSHHAMQRILEYLDRGMHVVLEFGRYRDDLTAYILVANLLSRRIHERYVQRTEEARGGGTPPQPLAIVIEEAHRFLGPGIGSQTVFGTIAREMRKYSVTLLVVDQRPSGIDEEVLSQIGTKVVCLLDNERDIDAVLTGTAGGRELRQVLARLNSQQQALIFGHAVPLPIVVRTREYGSTQSYASLQGPQTLTDPNTDLDRDASDLFGS